MYLFFFGTAGSLWVAYAATAGLVGGRVMSWGSLNCWNFGGFPGGASQHMEFTERRFTEGLGSQYFAAMQQEMYRVSTFPALETDS